MPAEVFFIHPTMLLEGPAWNADLDDEEMNESVDVWPIRHQASAFAGAGRVFAPRYRQAHVRIFSLGDSLSWAAAEIAYQDVKAAFLKFLEWSDGRPIVLAGHSQGSFHGRRLLQEFFDGKALSERLVAAYLPGMDMYAHEFDALPVARRRSATTQAVAFLPVCSSWALSSHATPTAGSTRASAPATIKSTREEVRAVWHASADRGRARHAVGALSWARAQL